MSPGRQGRAPRRAGRASNWRAIRAIGGFTFAEDPTLAAPDARIIWHADMDPGALAAIAVASYRLTADTIDPAKLQPWLISVTDDEGEHAVLSDGWRRIRIDLAEGSLAAGVPVILHYRLSGIDSIPPMLGPLRGLIHLVRHGAFARTLFPIDARIERHLLVLRVHDARVAGASQREIVETFYPGCNSDRADSLRSRVRRMMREARRMADGGWRFLMRPQGR
jgi:hypothetical protein